MIFSKFMPKPFARAIEYNVIGLATFVANILLAWILFKYGRVQYLIATAIGSFFQAVVAFFVNKRWTFHIRNLSILHGLFVTLVIQISVSLIAVSLTGVGVEIFGWSFILARLASGIVAGIWAYVADSYFTFGVSPLK